MIKGIKNCIFGIISIIFVLSLIIGVRADIAPFGSLDYLVGPVVLLIFLAILGLIAYLIIRIIRKIQRKTRKRKK